MKLSRLAFTACIAALAVPLAAHAQYPAKPVRVLVGYVAGSSTDIVGRVMAEMVLGLEPSLPVAPFAFDRFKTAEGPDGLVI